MTLSMIKKDIENLKLISDPIRKRAEFFALLSAEVVRRGGDMPIVVGGFALELYTQGSYATGDIDIKAPEIIKPILKEMGFEKAGRTYMNKDLDIFVDWLGSGLNEGEAEDRTVMIDMGNNRKIRVLSIEDLIIDRLNAAKWWKDTDSGMWAKVLVEVKKSLGECLDINYLYERATKEDITDVLAETLKDMGAAKASPAANRP